MRSHIQCQTTDSHGDFWWHSETLDWWPRPGDGLPSGLALMGEIAMMMIGRWPERVRADLKWDVKPL